MNAPTTIAPVFRKVRLEEQTSDFEYWQSQSFEKRLATLEEIRREYHNHHDTQQGLQRVLTIIKR